jgi:hypothetical protein
MVSQAQEITDIIRTNWSLTGVLSKTETAAMQEVVRFFDRKQVKGNEWPKAVTVEKINDQANENTIKHPHFTQVRDKYIVTCLYRVTDVNPDTYSLALTNVEDMAKEVQSILATSFDPQAGNGIFFTVDSTWSKNDHLDGGQADLVRFMEMTLTKISSENPNVVEGYQGVFRISGGKIYTETYNVQSVYGMPQIDEPIVGNQQIPVYFTGIFKGRINADMYLTTEDIGALGTDINHIGTDLTNGEVSENIFLQQYSNATQTVTITHTIKIINFEVVGYVEDLVQLKMIGEIISHPTMAVA